VAIEPLTVGLAALAGYGLYSRSRHGRRMRRTGKTGRPKLEVIPKAPLVIASDCSSWEMPEVWIIQTAQPRFYQRLVEIHQATGGDLEEAKRQGLLDPVVLTYAVLDGEIGACPLPQLPRDDGTTLSFRELQADIPQHADYYPHPAILGLFDTIYEAVEAALSVLEQTRDPARALLFPV
jgi:hypothetical protein